MKPAGPCCRASEWRAGGFRYHLEMMADMAESDDSGKQVLKAELLAEIAGGAARCAGRPVLRFDFRLAVGARRAGCSTLLVRADHHAGGVRAVCRLAVWRCLREDTGLATPTAGNAGHRPAWDCFTRVRPAESERAIARPCLSGLRASNAVCTAFKAALAAGARDRPDYDVSLHLRNAPTS